VIVRVDGQDVADLPLAQIVQRVRGPAGTEVTLTVIHRGETSLSEIKVVRAKITVPSVAWTMLSGTSVAHILLSQFAERATSDLVAAIKEARAAGATALILDLRNNPGGLLEEAIGVASQFLGEGNVVLEQDAQGRRTSYHVRQGGSALDLPLVILINEGSASASEIVAGAIQDYRRAPLVGTTTFGTGTVLSLFRLEDGSAIYLGTKQWLTPEGHEIWHRGVTPDIPVELAPTALPLLPQEAADLTPGQLYASPDAQLLRALAEVRQPVPVPVR
jgi:carboxyl-terminal processing protease